MRTKLVRIGNSRGVRLPKALLDQCQFGELVEIEVEQGRLVITPVSHPRAGWEDAFQAMAAKGDDALLDEGNLPATAWDESEW